MGDQRRPGSPSVAQVRGVNAAQGNTRVAEATRKRILAAARKLGYVRNESARRLKTGQSNAVGFVGGDLRNPFFAELTACLEEELLRRGLQLVIAHVAPGSAASFRRVVEVLQQQTVKRIVCWDESPQSRQRTANLPLLSIGFTTRPRPGVWYPRAIVPAWGLRSTRRWCASTPSSRRPLAGRSDLTVRWSTGRRT